MNLSLTTESNVLYHIKNWKEKNDVTLKQTSEQRTFWKILNQIKIQKGWYVFTDKNSDKVLSKILILQSVYFGGKKEMWKSWTTKRRRTKFIEKWQKYLNTSYKW